MEKSEGDPSKTESKQSKKQAETCPICQIPITARAVLEPCHHEFDYECIAPWFVNHDECPVCRQTCTRLLHDIVSDDKFQFDIIQRLEPQNQDEREETESMRVNTSYGSNNGNEDTSSDATF